MNRESLLLEERRGKKRELSRAQNATSFHSAYAFYTGFCTLIVVKLWFLHIFDTYWTNNS